jgi:hypothetical protein
LAYVSSGLAAEQHDQRRDGNTQRKPRHSLGCHRADGSTQSGLTSSHVARRCQQAPRRSNALDLDQTFRGFAAVGMYLQAGVKLAIDRGRPFQIPYSWCLINACIAADLADAKLINEMDAARA